MTVILTTLSTYKQSSSTRVIKIFFVGSSEVVLLLCAAPNSSGNWCLFQTSLSDLFGKRTGGHSVEAVDSSNFASQEMELPLMEGEEVIELVFQPAASSIATRYSAGSVQEEAVQLRLLHSAWSQTSTGVVAKTRQLVGLLTNSRVLLLGSDLSILESVTHSFVLQRHDNYDTSERMGIVGNQRVTISNTFSTAAITSISWIGASLCCCSVDGKVTYLSVPISATEKVETETSTLIGRSTGCLLTGNKDSVLYSWMSMPTNLGANGSLALLGVLTDRVIVMHTKMNKVHGGTQVSVTFRPANPVEPLLVSLIRLCDREESFPREYQFLLIAALLSYYYPLKQNAASTGQGALPTTQNSRFLVNFLYRARHCKELAAIIAGIPADVSEGANAAEFPALRWLSPAVRTELCFFARNNALNLSYLGREILGHKPDLQDLYIYGDAYGGNKLPSLRGDFSQRLSYAAATGKSDSRGSTISRKLADIAGDYLQAAHLSSEVENQAKSAETFVRNCINCNVSTIKATILTTIQGKLPSSSINEEARISFLRRRLYLGNLQDFDRNRSVPTLSVALTKEDYKCEHSSMMHLIEERRQEAHQRRGGGIGVSNGTVLGTLGLDVMEDFMGINHQLELLIPDVIDGVATEVQGDGASAAPSDWVEGVGQGREFDKVVGYWRFSDYAYEGEEFFSSVSTNPGSHLVVLDLSKFEVGLELVTDATATEGSVAFLPTSSGIDAGEKHDNTKALYDVVINGSVMLQHGTGSYLRSYVPRGSQLDVGLYHQDLSRLRCTMEIAIAFDVSQHPNNVAAQVLSSCESHTLLERAIVAGDYLHDTGLLWKLWVDKGGSVALSIRTDAGKIVDVRTEASMLTFGQLDSSSKNKDDELDDLAENSGSLRWHHIAVVLEGSPSRPFEEDNKMLWSSSTLNVNIYVDGQRCANSQISLSAISAQELERNMFYVGRGLCTGWRYTELRIWAEARRESEIDGARDQFLPLAMKRRRQQLRMKGTKKLFSAFAAAQTPLPEPSKSVYLPRFATFEFNEKANAAAADETASAAATSTSKSIANSEVVMEVLAPPLPLGAPPPPSTNRRRSVAGPLPSPLGPGLLKPPTLLPAVSQRELEVKAASSSLNDGEYSTEHNGEVNGGTSANPGLSSAAKARLARRRMTMPANVVATSAGDHVQMPPVDSSDRELNAAEPKGDSVGIDPSKKTEEPNEVAKQIPASFVDNRLEIPNSEQLLSPNLLQDKLPSEAVLASIDDVAVDDKANSSADSAAKTIATVANIKSTHSKEYWWSEIISMSKIGCAFTLDRLVRTTQSKLISHPQNLVLPVVDNKVVELVDLQQHPKPLPSTDPFRLLRTEAAFFDSAVSSFCKSGDDNRLLVTYTSNNKTISFYQWRDDGVTLFLDGFYEMTLPSPLAFWTFVTPEVLLVVTSSAGYSWKVSHKPSGFVVSKPMKILERIDVESPVRYFHAIVKY